MIDKGDGCRSIDAMVNDFVGCITDYRNISVLNVKQKVYGCTTWFSLLLWNVGSLNILNEAFAHTI